MMLMQSGFVVSIALAIGLVSASMDPKVLLAVFSGTQIGGQGISLAPFINALHLAFLVGVVASLLGAVASLMRGEHRSFEAGEERPGRSRRARAPDDPRRAGPVRGCRPGPAPPQLPLLLLRPADLRHRDVDADAGPGLAPGHAGRAGTRRSSTSACWARFSSCRSGPGPLRRDHRRRLAEADDGHRDPDRGRPAGPGPRRARLLPRRRRSGTSSSWRSCSAWSTPSTCPPASRSWSRWSARRTSPTRIALNSAVFNGARIVGPAIGGVLIGLLGTALCFILNGLSYGAVVIGLLAMRESELMPAARLAMPRSVTAVRDEPGRRPAIRLAHAGRAAGDRGHRRSSPRSA